MFSYFDSSVVSLLITILHFYKGVDDVDYTLYPGRDMQIAWLKEYLLYFYGEKKEILKSEVEKLYITVNKFALVCPSLSACYAMLWV